MHTVIGICFEHAIAFDLAAPAQVFACATREGEQLYRVSTCTPAGDPVRTTGGFDLTPEGGLELLAAADTILVPAYATLFDAPPEQALEALREASGRGARMISVCTGAFALAHAGLLDGRRATTHWGWAGELASRFPAVEVDPAALFVDEGAVMTSAGLSA